MAHRQGEKFQIGEQGSQHVLLLWEVLPLAIGQPSWTSGAGLAKAAFPVGD